MGPLVCTNILADRIAVQGRRLEEMESSNFSKLKEPQGVAGNAMINDVLFKLVNCIQSVCSDKTIGGRS